jgi:hypothetical protein
LTFFELDLDYDSKLEIRTLDLIFETAYYLDMNDLKSEMYLRKQTTSNQNDFELLRKRREKKI